MVALRSNIDVAVGINGRLGGYPSGESLRCVLCFLAEAGDSVWCLRISGSNSSTGARHQVKTDLTPSLFGVSLYLFLVAGQREVIFMRSGVPTDMATPLKIPFSWVVVSAKLMGDSHTRWRALAHEVLLANPPATKFVWPTCLLGRQKS